MKRKNIFALCLLLAGLGTALTGCYEDKSSLRETTLPSVVIDTTGIGGAIHVGYFDRLTLAPEISRNGEKNPSGLTYEWYITDAPNSTEYLQLGTEPVLDTIISLPIHSNYYTLFFKVTDTENDNLEAYTVWQLYIQSAFVDGLLIADTKDGVSSDFTLIKNKDLTVNYSSDEVIYRDMLASQDVSFNRIVSSMSMITKGYPQPTFSHTNYVFGSDEEGKIFGFDLLDCSPLEDSELAIYMPEASFNKFYHVNQLVVVPLSDGTGIINNRNNFMPLVLPATGLSLQADNGVFVMMPHSSATNNILNFYDKSAGKFVTYNSYFQSPYLLSTNFESSSLFNPNSLPGKTVVDGAMSITSDKITFLMKDDATGDYAIYALSAAAAETETTPAIPAAPYLLRNIPDEGKALLDQAVSTAFACNEAVLFIATESGIHAINFQMDPATVVPAATYTPDAGETISKIKLYQQGAYTVDRYMLENSYISELPLNNKALIVVTHNDAMEGKVSVVPMKNLGSGELDKNSAMVYDGFGRVLDVMTTHY